MTRFLRRSVTAFLAALMVSSLAQAARISDVKNTKHNLSTSGAEGGVANATKSTTESQICVFCHTPHGANATAAPPLWNRKIGGSTNDANTYSATYTPYSSESLDARSASVQSGWSGQPLGSSKLCLSCHDGTIALGNVINAPGSGLGSSISVNGSTATTMPTGTDGYTRNLGQNLANDHPISITYSSALASQDGELRSPSTMVMVNSTHPLVGTRAGGQGSGIGNLARSTGVGSSRPVLPLEVTSGAGGGNGQVQCTTCHDPHIRETNLDKDSTDQANVALERNIKFLRRNRFQMDQPTQNYSDTNDIICLACHQKGHDDTGANSFSWAYSSHANKNVATATYKPGAADTRQFPQNMPVWKVACLNCHDTHTVTGARRLTRGGVSGGNAALEETCYQCHRPGADVANVLNSSSNAAVPDIYTDFQATYKMPIAVAPEVHDIGGHTAQTCAGGLNKCGADFVEQQSLLANRHAECTDCHNPHRVVRLHRYDGKVESGGAFTAGIDLTTNGQTDKEGTHYHVESSGYTHNNVASGVLRGTWGVEPDYDTWGNRNFNTPLTQNLYTVRRGDPGADSLNPGEVSSGVDTKTYVTREYQVCLKCHSSYAYGSTPPSRSPTINGLSQYTDQAREFQSPPTHATESTSNTCPGANCVELGADGGADAAYNRHNHRSWHPVLRPTGRTASMRSASANSWRSPFNNAVGTQTMYCSDCHGSSTAASTVIPGSTVPASGAGNPWGPHGSANPFILKGVWDNETGYTGRAPGDGWSTNALCQKCHDPSSGNSGFSNGSFSNLHNHHQDKIQRLECTWCHIAVPHGWKNKAFLVNLNDVGPEAGQTGSKEVNISGNNDYFSYGPYYLEAKLKVRNFARSGQWAETACGSSNKAAADRINSTNGQTSNRTSNGLAWMTDGACNSAP